MVAKRDAAGNSKPRRPPATTPEGRERDLVSLAYDLAEKQLREGSASAQVIANLIKVGGQRERLEQEKLITQLKLDTAKIAQIESAQRTEELYERAINAMKIYSGQEIEEEDGDYVR